MKPCSAGRTSLLNRDVPDAVLEAAPARTAGLVGAAVVRSDVQDLAGGR